MCETIKRTAFSNSNESFSNIPLEYSKSVNHTSSISKASLITFKPEGWSSIISVVANNPAGGNEFAALSAPIKKRIEQLGLTQLVEGKVFQNARIHKYENSSTVYQGEVVMRGSQEIPHGFGKLYLEGGSFYLGTFAYGFAHGPGKLFLPNGDYYEGNFTNNLISGYGKFIEGSTVYEGGLQNGVFHGRGSLTSPHATFTGNFNNGQKSQGTLVWGEKKDYVYTGAFKNEVFHGKGNLQSPDGMFEGQFENGHKKGFGVFNWTRGGKYIGEYQNDLRNGFGEYFSSKGQTKYKGFWRDDQPVGQVLQQQEDPRRSY